MLAFPNCLQHRVSAVNRKPGVTGTATAHRRIVVYWLVDPNAGKAGEGNKSADDVEVETETEAAPPTPQSPRQLRPQSLAMAEFCRELLMIERKYCVADQNFVFERLISLCEH